MKMTSNIPAATVKLGTALIMGAVLAACGGGDDGKESADLSGSVTITGTAATVVAGSAGTAIGGAAVLVTCAQGQGTGMTAADGSFSVTVAKPGVAPCVLQLFRADNSSLRSVATGSGNFNITPMTELLVQYISAQINPPPPAPQITPGTINSPIPLTSSPAFAKLMGTPTLLNHSIARVSEFAKSVPGPASPSLAVPADFLTATLVPRSATAAGNAQSAFLEALRARNTITTTGTLNATTASAAIADANLPANKVTAP